MLAILAFFTRLFPLWILLGAFLAFLDPSLFTWFTGNWISFSLGGIMLGMGVTLRVEDFQRVFRLPFRVGLGVLLQYTLMPVLGGSIGTLLGLSPPFAAGLALVASCPGGTASNVIAYLARANVALSVTMTALSTLLASLLTPLLASFLIGSTLHVDVMGLFLGTAKVVLLPVLAGVLLNSWFPFLVRPIQHFAPPVAVLLIVMIVSSVLGQGREAIFQSGSSLFLSVLLLHGAGFLSGYGISRLLVDEESARTISIEVGMQNSGLGVVLARGNFSNPLVAIPSALSSMVHSILGSLLAALWRRVPADGRGPFFNPLKGKNLSL